MLLAALTALLPTAPTYDPWAWVVWGREITEWNLSTVDGPSWKPLPVIFTTLTGQLGDASPVIWTCIARAGAIAGVMLAFLLAKRFAGTVAGVVAAAGLALMPWWLRNATLGNSEGLMVALVFGAVLTELHGRRGWAFTLGVGAALLRPEVWPFLGLYALVLAYRDRSRLKWIVPGLLTLPLLWLVPEWWGSGNAFRASDRAQNPNPNSPAFAEHPALEVLKDWIGTTPAVAVAGAVVAVVLALAARERPARRELLGLVVLALAWAGLVAVMTSRGFSGNQRYLIPPAALLIVVGAVGLVWLLQLGWRRRAPVALAALVAVGLSAAFVLPDAGDLDPVMSEAKHQIDLVDELETLVAQGGGAAALKACGHPFTNAFMVPQVAWRLHLHTNQVSLRPAPPAVVFHVRLGRFSRFYGPGLRDAAPHYRARVGDWVLSADCPAPTA